MADKNKSFKLLTGGGADTLDAFAYAALTSNDFAFGIYNGMHHVYRYDTTLVKAATESPYFIVPADNGTGTGAWVLQGFQGAMSHVYVANANGQTINAATETPIAFIQEIHDSLGEFTGNEFTAKNNGLYQTCGEYNFDTDDWTAGDDHFGIVNIDGNPHAYTKRYTISATVSTIRIGGSFSKVIPLTTGEVLEFAIQHNNTGGSVDLRTANTWNWLTIDRLI